MKKVLLGVIISFAIFSCNQDEITDPVKEPEKIKFTGIRQMDSRGLPLSPADPDDWNFTDTWVEQEMSLFGSNLKTDCVLPESYGIIAYPNPCIDKINLHVNKPAGIRMAVRVVDKNFKTLFAKDSLYATINMLDFGQFGVKDTVRVYYKFIDGACEFRGHGDVVIQN